MTTRLTFQNGEFILDTGNTELLRDGDWRVLNPNGKHFSARRLYATLDFQAAARLKQYADDSALEVLARAFVKRYSAPAKPLPLFLDPHQRDGVLHILTRSRSYLAHAPGAGKTCEAITAAILAEGAGQVVFIVPPSLTANWARETMAWASRLMPARAWPAISVIPESARQDFAGWGADFVIVPDSMLTKPWVLDALTNLRCRFLAVDEASRFKEAGAARTRALFGGELGNGRSSPGLVYGPRHAVLLDGSPMPNRAMELWAPTYAMCPEAIDFMNQEAFGFKFCGAEINDYGRWEFKRSANLDELRDRLQKEFMHVVTEEQLDHPERRRSMLYTNTDPRTPAMRTWERKNLATIRFDDIDEEASQGALAAHRRELGIRKVPFITQYARMRLEKGEQVLLFAWHREVAEALAHNLHDFYLNHKYVPLVMGGTSEEHREAVFDQFQRGRLPLIVGNILAMGRGHNLQRADRVIFGEFSWTDETNKQAEKRASRKGSTKSFVRCDYVVAPGTLDEPVLQSVFRKAANVRRVIG